MLSFGDFKKNEIAKFIGNKDPLGLNSDINMSTNNSDTAIESYTTIKPNTKDKAISPNTETKTKMVHEAIPLYLRAGNCNNSADTNKDENNTPTLQVTSGNVSEGQGQGQVRVDIYLLAQSCWREIRGFLHKEMNLRIKSSFYEVLSKNEIYTPWTITFQQPPNLMTNPQQIETTMSLRKNQTKDML